MEDPLVKRGKKGRVQGGEKGGAYRETGKVGKNVLWKGTGGRSTT